MVLAAPQAKGKGKGKKVVLPARYKVSIPASAFQAAEVSWTPLSRQSGRQK
jgi:hypothetical protein